MDRSDATIVRFKPVAGPPQRVRFEPRSDGSWDRIEEVWTGCVWRPLGREAVTRLTID